MQCSAVLLFLLISFRIVLCDDADNSSNSFDGDDMYKSTIIRNAVCYPKYSMSCLKLDMVSLVEKMGGGAKYQILPGVYLSHRLEAAKAPRSLLETLTTGNSTKEVDIFISNKVNEYLNSLTLSVKVLDTNTINHARMLSEKILASFIPAQTGRKKGSSGILWAASSVAAVGMAVLAAISGKALMTSLLALMLAGTGALRGNNNPPATAPSGCKSSTIYDHGRTIELDRIATSESNIYNKELRPVYRPASFSAVTHYGQ